METCSSTVEGTHEHLHASECRKWLVVLKTTRQKKKSSFKTQSGTLLYTANPEFSFAFRLFSGLVQYVREL